MPLWISRFQMTDAAAKTLILASQSQSRRAMLDGVGLLYDAMPARIDEMAISESMASAGAKPRDIADSLAEAKAIKLSRKFPLSLVIGSDQILVGPDGGLIEKADSIDEAMAVLKTLSGKTHQLISAAVICESGKPVWRAIETAKMTMRPLSDNFIKDYTERYYDAIQYCVGCYRIEAEGAQLFAKIEGSHFAIQGMPLLPILDYLRIRQWMPS